METVYGLASGFFVFAVLALVGLASGYARLASSPRRLASAPTGDVAATIFAARMVVVNTKKPDDQSLRGQMVDDGQQSGWVVLRAPALHVAGEATASWEKLPADVSIPLAHVAWIIDVPAEADAVV